MVHPVRRGLQYCAPTSNNVSSPVYHQANISGLLQHVLRHSAWDKRDSGNPTSIYLWLLIILGELLSIFSGGVLVLKSALATHKHLLPPLIHMNKSVDNNVIIFISFSQPREGFIV